MEVFSPWCFRCGHLWAARLLIGLRTNPRLWACTIRSAGLLIRLRAHPGFQLWAPSLLIWVRANRASGVCCGCLSRIHSPEAEGPGLL